MNIGHRPVPEPPAMASGRARHRRRRYFLAWLLERCGAVPRSGHADQPAAPRVR